ncbi:MAG: hemin transporter HemP [Comamonadaceae bacterium PBBC2]|nr:MAG: hemin transporter HemP [Comamonadaceae bacterium PBBC2]
MTVTPPTTLPDDTAGALPGAAPAAVGAATDKPLAAGNTEEVLTAQTLLVGRPWVGIEHNGQHYRLQTTRAGKLILTK